MEKPAATALIGPGSMTLPGARPVDAPEMVVVSPVLAALVAKSACVSHVIELSEAEAGAAPVNARLSSITASNEIASGLTAPHCARTCGTRD